MPIRVPVARPLRRLLPLLCACVLLPLVAVRAASAELSTPSTQELRFHDDLELPPLDEALIRSLAYLHTLPASTRYDVAGTAVPVQRLIDSARHLRALLRTHPDPATLDRRIRQDFTVSPMPPPTTNGKRMLITGYYQPIFAGSLRQQPPYRFPLYRVPPDLLVRKLHGRAQVLGRKDHGRILPYWTRAEIEQGNLLQGAELVWLRDPFDAFVLHIQGSGIIHLDNGTVRGVHYALNNGREYRSIGKYLVDTGRMALAEVTMESIRAYIDRHPEERDLILHHNTSFVFFAWSKPGPAIGNLNQALTAGRSIAADQRWYPPGAVVLLDTRRPLMQEDAVIGWQRMCRLVTVQDTGSALQGPGRIDVFWGTGDQAGREAGQMKEDGTAALLLLNPEVQPLP
jgi:membrane-bound lytic murein transglycosylase A